MFFQNCTDYAQWILVAVEQFESLLVLPLEKETAFIFCCSNYTSTLTQVIVALKLVKNWLKSMLIAMPVKLIVTIDREWPQLRFIF